MSKDRGYIHPKVLIATPHPATDYLFWPKKNRYQIASGGKGRNVKRALDVLNCPSVSLCLEQDVVRSNITVYQNLKSSRRFMGLGTPATLKQKNQFKKNYTAFLKQVEIVLLCGSAPSKWDAIFPWMIREAQKHRKRVWVDSSRKALERSVQAKPCMVKPNLKELEELFGKPLRTRRLQIKAADDLCRRGIEMTAVTLGQEGAILCKEEQIWYAKPPKIKDANDLGCGDVFFAALCAAFLKKMPAERMLSQALAAATASTATCIPGEFKKSYYSDLEKKIHVQRI